eukprot:m.72949 g.72949  ORF g.72949 m.72949 type:complete len:295 (+) comp14436_c1_seq2:670-1554(+)
MDVISEVKTVVYSGNMRQCAASTLGSWNVTNTTTELLSALGSAVTSWKAKNPTAQLASTTAIHASPCAGRTISTYERSQVTVTVKLVLVDACPSHVKEALAAVCLELNVEWVDLVILSLNMPASPRTSPTPDDSSDTGSGSDAGSPKRFASSPSSSLPAQFLPVWRALEAEQAAGRTRALGVCDLNATQLTELLAEATVKPVVNQVAFSTPCSYKDEAVKRTAAAAGIQLMTHSDASVMVPVSDCEAVTKKQLGIALSPRWVARYSSLDETRSVIADFGFVYGLVGANTTIINF